MPSISRPYVFLGIYKRIRTRTNNITINGEQYIMFDSSMAFNLYTLKAVVEQIGIRLNTNCPRSLKAIWNAVWGKSSLKKWHKLMFHGHWKPKEKSQSILERMLIGYKFESIPPVPIPIDSFVVCIHVLFVLPCSSLISIAKLVISIHFGQFIETLWMFDDHYNTFQNGLWFLFSVPDTIRLHQIGVRFNLLRWRWNRAKKS